MKQLKKWLGLVWMSLAPVLIFLLVRTAAAEISRSPVIDTKIQWAVFILVFLPIAAGFFVFGYYAWKGEYEEN